MNDLDDLRATYGKEAQLVNTKEASISPTPQPRVSAVVARSYGHKHRFNQLVWDML